MSATPSSDAVRRLTVGDIARMHADGQRIPMLTAYDYPTAKLVDEAGHPADPRRRLARPGDARLRERDPGLDGGHAPPHRRRHPRREARPRRSATCRSSATPRRSRPSPTRAGSCRRPAPRPSRSRAASASARTIEALVKAGIPTMGHIGWTPQAANAAGKVRVLGKSREQARALLHDALAVQEAGAFSIVLELVPEQLAAAITERLRIPTIGIGAGAGCSGQVQVITDLLGWDSWHPKHAKPYADLRGTILAAAAGLRGGRRRGHVPRARADRPDGRRGARRGPRPVRTWTPARRRSSRGSRSTATSEPVGAPARSRSLRGMTSTEPAVSAPRHGIRVVRTRAELRDALADLPRPIGLVPDDGLAPRRPSLADRARPRRQRRRPSRRSSSTRASSTRRPTTSAIRATRPATSRSARRRASTSSSPRTSRRSTRRASTRPSRSARSPGRSRGPPGRATSTGSRRSWRSCST